MDISLEKYLSQLEPKPSETKQIIITTLWSGRWIKGTSIARATNQKEYTRRIRELRQFYGCDIETTGNGSAQKYRLKSKKLGDANIREYLPPGDKAVLFRKHNHQCAFCRRRKSQGKTGLQADHKVPVEKGGSSAGVENWQPLCHVCNLLKKQACSECDMLDCNTCPYAFPENFDIEVKVTRK